MPKVDEVENVIMDYVDKHGSISRKKVEELLNVKSTKAYNVLKKMCENDKLKVIGNGKLKEYILNK